MQHPAIIQAIRRAGCLATRHLEPIALTQLSSAQAVPHSPPQPASSDDSHQRSSSASATSAVRRQWHAMAQGAAHRPCASSAQTATRPAVPCPWQLQPVRSMAQQASSDSSAQAGELSEHDYHHHADELLEKLHEAVEEYVDNLDLDGTDVEYGQGVLTMKLGRHGTYVINKQAPNKQIWMSSPISGPTRYDWVRGTGWVYTRDGRELLDRVSEEVTKLCGEELDLSDCR